MLHYAINDAVFQFIFHQLLQTRQTPAIKVKPPEYVTHEECLLRCKHCLAPGLVVNADAPIFCEEQHPLSIKYLYTGREQVVFTDHC